MPVPRGHSADERRRAALKLKVAQFHDRGVALSEILPLLEMLLSLVFAVNANADQILSGTVVGSPDVANPLQVRQLSVSYNYTKGTLDATIMLFEPLPSPGVGDGSISVKVAAAGLPGSDECEGVNANVAIVVGGAPNPNWNTASVQIGSERTAESIPVDLATGGKEVSVAIANSTLVDYNLGCFYGDSWWASSIPPDSYYYQGFPITFFPGFPRLSLGIYEATAEYAAGAERREEERQAKATAEQVERQKAAEQAVERGQRELIERRNRENAELDARAKREETEDREAIPRKKCVVPPLRGESLGAARKRLHKINCRLGRVTVTNGERHALVVVGQNPTRGRRLRDGAPVSVRLGVALEIHANDPKPSSRPDLPVARGRSEQMLAAARPHSSP